MPPTLVKSLIDIKTSSCNWFQLNNQEQVMTAAKMKMDTAMRWALVDLARLLNSLATTSFALKESVLTWMTQERHIFLLRRKTQF